MAEAQHPSTCPLLTHRPRASPLELDAAKRKCIAPRVPTQWSNPPQPHHLIRTRFLSRTALKLPIRVPAHHPSLPPLPHTTHVRPARLPPHSPPAHPVPPQQPARPALIAPQNPPRPAIVRPAYHTPWIHYARLRESRSDLDPECRPEAGAVDECGGDSGVVVRGARVEHAGGSVESKVGFV